MLCRVFGSLTPTHIVRLVPLTLELSSPSTVLNQKAAELQSQVEFKASLPARLQDGGYCVGSSEEKSPLDDSPAAPLSV